MRSGLHAGLQQWTAETSPLSDETHYQQSSWQECTAGEVTDGVFTLFFPDRQNKKSISGIQINTNTVFP